MSHFFVNSLIIYDHCKVYSNTWFTMEFAISHHSNQFYSILNWWFLSGECSYSIHISESMTCSFAMLEWATGIAGTSRFTEIRIIIFIVIWFRMCSQFFSCVRRRNNFITSGTDGVRQRWQICLKRAMYYDRIDLNLITNYNCALNFFSALVSVQWTYDVVITRQLYCVRFVQKNTHTKTSLWSQCFEHFTRILLMSNFLLYLRFFFATLVIIYAVSW